MASDFDPYAAWLGISPLQRPITYYDLLGVARSELRPEVIEQAAAARLAKLQANARTPQAALAKRLLLEVEAARACLLKPEARQRYDRTIGALAAAKTTGPAPPPAEPAVVPPPKVAAAEQPLDLAALESLVRAEATAIASPVASQRGTIDWASRVQRGIYVGGFVFVLVLSLLLGLVAGRNVALVAAELPIWHESPEEVERVAQSERGKRIVSERESEIDRLSVKYMAMFASAALASIIVGGYYLMRY